MASKISTAKNGKVTTEAASAEVREMSPLDAAKAAWRKAEQHETDVGRGVEIAKKRYEDALVRHETAKREAEEALDAYLTQRRAAKESVTA